MRKWRILLGMVFFTAMSVCRVAGGATEFNSVENKWCRDELDIPNRPLKSRTTPAGTRLPLISLALSGGGYRAMLFHVGTLRRLNDAGLLPELSVVSSVSGGSIVAGLLAQRWYRLGFNDEGKATRFIEEIENPLRDLASRTTDVSAAIGSMLPFMSAASIQASRFDELLFEGALLQDIAPGPDQARLRPDQRPRPLFIFNATSLQTGELWQFRPTAMGGSITHWTSTANIRLSQAVAASSGFPPVLSPLELDLSNLDVDRDWHDCVDGRDNPFGIRADNEPNRDLPRQEKQALSVSDDHWKLAQALRRKVFLVDGGVRDNLGLGTIEEINRLRRQRSDAGSGERTVILISDGGAATVPNADVSGFWPTQVMRVMNIMSDQPDEVRVANIVRRSAERVAAAGYAPTQWSNDDHCPPPDIPEKLVQARRIVVQDPKTDAYAYWSIRRMPKLHRSYQCPPQDKSSPWMEKEVRALAVVPTRMSEMPKTLQARLINWGYLAAHHGLPYVDDAWVHRDLFQRWLAPCNLPYGKKDTLDGKKETESAAEANCLLPLPRIE